MSERAQSSLAAARGLIRARLIALEEGDQAAHLTAYWETRALELAAATDVIAVLDNLALIGATTVQQLQTYLTSGDMSADQLLRALTQGLGEVGP